MNCRYCCLVSNGHCWALLLVSFILCSMLWGLLAEKKFRNNYEHNTCMYMHTHWYKSTSQCTSHVAAGEVHFELLIMYYYRPIIFCYVPLAKTTNTLPCFSIRLKEAIAKYMKTAYSRWRWAFNDVQSGRGLGRQWSLVWKWGGGRVCFLTKSVPIFICEM